MRVYKDFSFEYPPLALPLFTLPPHARRGARTRTGSPPR